MLTDTQIKAREQLVLALKGAAMLRVRVHRAQMALGLLWLRDLARLQTLDEPAQQRFKRDAAHLFGSFEAARPVVEIACEQGHSRAALHIARGRGDTLILQRRGGGQRVIARPRVPVSPHPEHSELWRVAERVRNDPGDPAYDDPDAVLFAGLQADDPSDTVLPALTWSRDARQPLPRPKQPQFTLWTTQWSDDLTTPPPFVIEPPAPGTTCH